MAKPKDDDSTDILAKVKAFARDMDGEMEDFAKAREKEIAAARKELDKETDPKARKKKEKALPKPFPKVTFAVDPNPATESRTPAEQAEMVAKGLSSVCWSAHMADRARHVLMKVDGRITFDAKKALGDDFAEFRKIWAKVMKANGLRNHKGGEGWGEGDEFHLEIEAGKVGRSDQRAEACLDEYARLTRTKGYKPNESFEKAYAKELEAHIEKYTPKAESSARGAPREERERPGSRVDY